MRRWAPQSDQSPSSRGASANGREADVMRPSAWLFGGRRSLFELAAVSFGAEWRRWPEGSAPEAVELLLGPALMNFFDFWRVVRILRVCVCVCGRRAGDWGAVWVPGLRLQSPAPVTANSGASSPGNSPRRSQLRGRWIGKPRGAEIARASCTHRCLQSGPLCRTPHEGLLGERRELIRKKVSALAPAGLGGSWGKASCSCCCLGSSSLCRMSWFSPGFLFCFVFLTSRCPWS